MTLQSPQAILLAAADALEADPRPLFQGDNGPESSSCAALAISDAGGASMALSVFAAEIGWNGTGSLYDAITCWNDSLPPDTAKETVVATLRAAGHA